MRYKKYIVILILSIIIFFIMMYLYNNVINKNEFISCYITNKDIMKGEKIDFNDLIISKIEQNSLNLDFLSVNSNIENMVMKNDIKKGSIIYTNDLILKSEFDYNKEYEYISLKINSSDDSVSYQTLKDTYVNVYYTAKTSQISDLINSDENNKEDFLTLGIEEAYTTINILQNIKVIDAFNKSGISLQSGEVGTDTLVDTIMISVNRVTALKINNLKKYGTFSFSLKR